MKDTFLGFLAQTLNKPVEEIAELLYQKGDDGSLSDDLVENAADVLKKLDVERVKKLRETADSSGHKKALEDQRKRGYKEAREELEKELRETYGIESDKTGADLVADIVAKAAKSDLPDDKVKRHPLFLDLEKRFKTEVSTLKEQHEAERGELEKQYAKKFTLADVKARALSELDKMNPVLHENPAIAAKLKSVFASEFEHFDFERQENGEYLVLKGEKRLEDDHGNPVGFDKLVKETASQYFTFKEQSAKGSAANRNGSGGDSTGSGKVPKDENDLWEMYNKTTDPTERRAILEAYEKEHGEIPA